MGVRIRKSVWLFPAILFLIVTILSAAKVSGSSIGSYHDILYGKSIKDSSLLWGHPRTIRSDEWAYMTQMTIAQAKAGYPRVNKNINTGRDMSLITDVPYKEWSTIFKPQNLAFFVIPFEYAFAFKWWLLLYLLIVSCYFFTLKLLPNKKLFSILFSLGVGFSPFVFWWYQTLTIAPLFYAFFILVICIRIVRKESIPFIRNSNVSQSIHLATLAYLITAFALVLYPPFQIPIGIVSAIFLAGFLLNERQSENFSNKELLSRVVWIVGAGLISLIICGVFVKTRSEPINRINHTIYPGSRVIKSGNISYLHVFDSFTMPILQSSSRAAKFFQNQSEASNFILLMPFLLIPAFALLWLGYKKTRRINWLLLSVQLVCLMLLCRIFIPFGDPLYKLMLLHKVPHERLVIGLGFAGILQIILMYAYSLDIKVAKKTLWIFAGVYGTLCWIILLVVSHGINKAYQGYISGELIWIILPTVFALMIYLVLLQKWILFAFVFAGFSFLSIVRINPLYRGLGPLGNNAILSRMQEVSGPNDSWAVADDLVYENFPMLINHDSVTGNQIYPDINFWRGIEGEKGDYIYNRYAHSVFNSNQEATQLIRLSSEDTFQAKLTCSPFVEKKVDYLLIPRHITLPCLREVGRVDYPNTILLIYKVTP